MAAMPHQRSRTASRGASSNSHAACPRACWNSASNCSHSAGANSASAARNRWAGTFDLRSRHGHAPSIRQRGPVDRRSWRWARRAYMAAQRPVATLPQPGPRTKIDAAWLPAARLSAARGRASRPPGATASTQPHHGQLHHPAPVRPASPGPSGSATPSSSWVTPSPPRPVIDAASFHTGTPSATPTWSPPKYLDTAAWAPGSPLTGRGSARRRDRCGSLAPPTAASRSRFRPGGGPAPNRRAPTGDGAGRPAPGWPGRWRRRRSSAGGGGRR